MFSFLLPGDIPDLFSDEEVDMIVTSMRMELRGLGLIDSRDNCWSFFIERIRRQLKVGCFQCGSQSAALARSAKVRHLLPPPGGPVFLPRWLHAANTSQEVSRSGELHSHRLVPPVASAGTAVCQLHFHREDTWIRGDSVNAHCHCFVFLVHDNKSYWL